MRRSRSSFIRTETKKWRPGDILSVTPRPRPGGFPVCSHVDSRSRTKVSGGPRKYSKTRAVQRFWRGVTVRATVGGGATTNSGVTLVCRCPFQSLPRISTAALTSDIKSPICSLSRERSSAKGKSGVIAQVQPRFRSPPASQPHLGSGSRSCSLEAPAA